jgi:hypothetical protein
MPGATAVAVGLMLVAALAGCGSSGQAKETATPAAAAEAATSAPSAAAPAPEPSLPAPVDSAAPNTTSVAGSGSGVASTTGSASSPTGGGTSRSSTSDASSGTTTHSTSATGSRAVPGIADGAAALPTSATVQSDSRCQIRSLRLEAIDLQGSPGGTYADFRLVNIGSKTCAVRGFVGARLINDAGRDMPTTVRHETGPDVWVQVKPRGAAQFHLRFPNPFAGDAPCNPPNAAKVRITLAGLSGSLTSATPEGGIQACNGQLSTAPLGST